MREKSEGSAASARTIRRRSRGRPSAKRTRLVTNSGFSAQFSMGGNVGLQITGSDRRHQGVSLVKGQGQAFAGDRVEGTRGVSEQG